MHLDDVKLAQVIIDAHDANQWHVLGAMSYPSESGRRPGGVIAFTEPHKAKMRRELGYPQEICGTAQFYVTESLETVFWGGHYDISRIEAMRDMTERALAYETVSA